MPIRLIAGWLAITAVTSISATAARADVPQLPYKAYVTVDDVYVRSGPGQSYYPTTKLSKGDLVEVYRHDPGGWYAIRPVEGSYSWVSSRFIELKDDNLALVTDENVAARVGSAFSDIRDVIQVRLHRGEVVELLPEDRRASPASLATEERWVRIAPPSGEFRWILGRFLDPEYPADGLSNPDESGSVATAQEAGDVDASTIGEQAGPVAPDSSVPRRLSSTGFMEEIEALELELSVMVVEEPSVWSFEDLRRRAESLLTQAENAVERGHARVLLGKIERFDDIRGRFHDIASAQKEAELASRLLSGVSRTEEPAEDTATPADTAAQSTLARTEPRTVRGAGIERRYDGTGVLTEVRAAKLGAPRFALVDENGGVRSYVTPAPGVNLRRYLGREVGITGSRTYSAEQKARHLMARHVNLLDGPQMR
ncbi:MAG: SH3 domain-containing protein [Planctomycetota bacterium]